MKATEQYIPIVPCIKLYQVVTTYESVDEILKRVHSNESYRPVPSCGAVYHAQQVLSLVTIRSERISYKNTKPV